MAHPDEQSSKSVIDMNVQRLLHHVKYGLLLCLLSACSHDIAYVSYNYTPAKGGSGRHDYAIKVAQTSGFKDIKKIVQLPDPIRYPQWSPDGKWVAFEVQDRRDSFYIADTKNSELKHMGSGGGLDWSPDSQKIAYVAGCCVPEAYDIWITTIDRLEKTKITDNQVSDTHPRWSPDGKRLAFFSQVKRRGRYSIYIYELATAQLQQVKSFEDLSVDDFDWLPDGQQMIASTSTRDNEKILYSIELSSDTVTKLVGLPGTDYDAIGDLSVAPNGTQVVFTFKKNTGDGAIYTMKVDGSGLSRLTPQNASDYDPEWSASSQQIVFTTGSSSKAQAPAIMIMNADGSNRVPLTTDPEHADGSNFDPDW